MNSELEQFILAYMYYQGFGCVDRDIFDSVIEHHLDRLEQNIMRFGKSVDFGSKAFGGEMPVIAFMIKIAGLEHKMLNFISRMDCMR